MESGSVFIDWLACIYLWITILHPLAILTIHLQAIINRKKNLRKWSSWDVLWKTFFKNLWKFTGKHLSWSIFFNKTAGWRPATLWKRDSGSDVFMWIFTIFKNINFVNGLLKQHIPQYAHGFFGMHVLQEHR